MLVYWFLSLNNKFSSGEYLKYIDIGLGCGLRIDVLGVFDG